MLGLADLAKLSPKIGGQIAAEWIGEHAERPEAF